MVFDTSNFTTTQKAKWSNGKAADQTNFHQFIDAIAQLVTQAETNIKNEVQPSQSGYSDDKAKAVAKLLLNTESDYNSTLLWTKLNESIANAIVSASNQVVTDYDAKLKPKVTSTVSTEIGKVITKDNQTFKTSVTDIVNVLLTTLKAQSPITYSYTYNGALLTITKNSGGVLSNISITTTTGKELLSPTTVKLPAEASGDDNTFFITRLDGARLVVNRSGVVKPAVTLIG